MSLTASFTINGAKYEGNQTYCYLYCKLKQNYILTADATFSDITLNEFLRKNLLITGTKVFCREGGCGACVVYAEIASPLGSTFKRSINSVKKHVTKN